MQLSLEQFFLEVSQNNFGNKILNHLLSFYLYLAVLIFFLKDFQSEVEVKNLDTKESYMIHERVVRDSVWLRMTSKDDKTRTCSYSKLSGFGHTIYGKRLTYLQRNLPNIS